ncbi:hypothetical protein GE061_015562 [Apolygus lucorum]|uniref:HTH psq-type domain-containing protein n=1 Tax=Apolygus lucorum TaxID=248454 RepID=A0A8S9XNE5_APOLU|nr:hypothetical protein GE061_015562 [Apolygus lucorum]
MTNDSGANIKAAVNSFLGEGKRISCMAHIINLIVNGALKVVKEFSKLADQTKVIVTFFKHSVNAMDALRAEQMASASLVIPLASLLKQEMEYPLKPTPANQETETEVGQSMAMSLSRIVEEVYPETTVGKSVARSLLKGVQDRLAPLQNQLFLAKATILDPRFKKIHFTDALAVGKAVSALSAEIRMEHRRRGQLSPELQQRTSTQFNKGPPSIWNRHEEIVKTASMSQHQQVTEREALPSDFKQYLDQPILAKGSNPVQFWIDSRHFTPVLSEIAMKFMGRVYQRKAGARPYRNYAEDSLEKAIEQVANGKTFRDVSAQCGIPIATLSHKFRGLHSKAVGRPTALSNIEERNFVTALSVMAEWGFLLTAWQCYIISRQDAKWKRIFPKLNTPVPTLGTTLNCDDDTLLPEQEVTELTEVVVEQCDTDDLIDLSNAGFVLIDGNAPELNDVSLNTNFNLEVLPSESTIEQSNLQVEDSRFPFWDSQSPIVSDQASFPPDPVGIDSDLPLQECGPFNVIVQANIGVEPCGNNTIDFPLQEMLSPIHEVQVNPVENQSGSEEKTTEMKKKKTRRCQTN